VKFAFIQTHLTEYRVGDCCRALQVSRAGYYRWRRAGPGARARRRTELTEKIRAVHAAHRGVYGSPRVYHALRAAGEHVCENTVAKVMKEQRIQAKTKKKFVPRTTDSQHRQPVAKNLLDRDFTAEKPNQKWVVDITYIPTGEGWLYLAGVLDLYSRKIVGWSMREHLETSLVDEALRMALVTRTPAAGLLHHSDRGSQYASDDYRKLLEDQAAQASMSEKGDCWDNACAESFWATLKTELVHHEEYPTRQAAKQSIFEYIEVFYNRQRLHSTLGYQSPEAFEAGRS
jgi:transposase InsO family protein